MTQNEMVLNHLKGGKTLTSLEALKEYGIMRLASRVDELRELDYEIDTKMIHKGRKHWAEYRLRGVRSKSMQETPLEMPILTDNRGQVCFA